MKKNITRIACLVLAVLMVLAAVGCSKKNNADKSSADAVTFPLKEKVTFNFMVAKSETDEFKENLANNALWKELEEKTNVHIDFTFLGSDAKTQLSLLVSAGTYGDFIWGGPLLGSAEASKYMASGIFQDLTDYIKEDIMPNFCADLKENPEYLTSVRSFDGKIYCLPKVTGYEGHYLESPIWINKAWLDKCGLAVPTTLDEFTNALRAFRDNDCNGNGDTTDEIPYLCSTAHSMMHTEALLGLWGLATKDGVNDAFVQVKNGKVTFVPTTNEYKEAIKWMNTLYTEKLMWQDCFTANADTINAKITNPTCLVGCFTNNTLASTAYKDEYVCMAPPKVTGYNACWFYHPAIMGSKNMFYVTNKCENVNVLCAWIDQFYDFDTSYRAMNGEVSEGRYEINAAGKYVTKNLDKDTLNGIKAAHPSLTELLGNLTTCYTPSDYAKYLEFSAAEQTKQNCYNIYKDYINKELWPRPFFAEEDSYDADTYFTDINYEVNTHRALWITGKSDIDADWDAYVKKINSIGLDKYIAMMQKTYDGCKSK